MQDKVQRHQLYEVVMECIRADIASGKLKAGDRLETVRELARRLGVGQSSVREAVRVLSYMGLLRVKHGGGIFVTERLDQEGVFESRNLLAEGDRASLRHLLELRLAIEPMSARLAAERATEDDIREIERRCNIVQELHEQNLKAFQEQSVLQEEDVLFHMAIVRGAHNALLLDALERVHSQLRESRNITSHVPQLVDSALRFHPQITESICMHDARHAENFMRAHLEDVMWWLEVYDAKRQARPREGQNVTNNEVHAVQSSEKGLLAIEFMLDSAP
jgi:GntR family transcriptional regulator, transcriptional repressor for pyruvate dehydrogenase complex